MGRRQGYTLFVVSWKNPDASYAETGFETYIEEGYLKAIDVACEINGEKQVNAVGYCVAGTTLALTLCAQGQARAEPREIGHLLHHVTEFPPGRVHALFDDDFVDAIERQVEGGAISKYYM